MTPQAKKVTAFVGVLVLIGAIVFIYFKSRLPDNCYREQAGQSSEVICD